MYERWQDKLQGEGEADPGSDPRTGALRRAYPALRNQRHWYVDLFTIKKSIY